MGKIAAVLGAILVLSQFIAAPAQAAVDHSEGTSVQAEKDDQRAPGGGGTNFPDRPGSLTAGPISDVKVELVSGWWVGAVRHSKYKVSNVGTGPSFDVDLIKRYELANLEGEFEDFYNEIQNIGTMPAGAIMFVTVVCTPQSLRQCHMTGVNAWTPGSDLNPENNKAEDHL